MPAPIILSKHLFKLPLRLPSCSLFVLALASAAGLLGCGTDSAQQPEAVRRFIEENRPAALPAIDAALVPPAAPVDYPSGLLRDPFRELINEAAPSTDEMDVKAYVQAISAGHFTMKGVLNYAGSRWALVEDVQGRAYRFTSGDELIVGRVQVAEVTEKVVRIIVFDGAGQQSAEYHLHLDESS